MSIGDPRPCPNDGLTAVKRCLRAKYHFAASVRRIDNLIFQKFPTSTLVNNNFVREVVSNYGVRAIETTETNNS